MIFKLGKKEVLADSQKYTNDEKHTFFQVYPF